MQQWATTDSTVAEFNSKGCSVANVQVEVHLNQSPGLLVAKLGDWQKDKKFLPYYLSLALSLNLCPCILLSSAIGSLSAVKPVQSSPSRIELSD